eukprot:5935336-Pyramimonas_sp.AAC.1
MRLRAPVRLVDCHCTVLVLTIIVFCILNQILHYYRLDGAERRPNTSGSTGRPSAHLHQWARCACVIHTYTRVNDKLTQEVKRRAIRQIVTQIAVETFEGNCSGQFYSINTK